jgi:hypothetical protein
MKVLSLLIAAFLLAACAKQPEAQERPTFNFPFVPQALAWTHGGAVAACAYTGDSNDGCSGTNQNDVFTFQAALGETIGQYARQNGQSWTSDHPWNFNAPGDAGYPVGYDKTLTLQNPAVNTLPSGCTYAASGRLGTGPLVECQSVANITFNGWNFTGVGLLIDHISGSCTLTNNLFAWSSALTTNQLVQIENDASNCPTSRDVEHNVIDGGTAAGNTLVNADSFVDNVQNGGTCTYRYNVWRNTTQRPVNMVNCAALTFDYNVCYLWNQNAESKDHGECFGLFPTTNYAITTFHADYNTIIIDSTTPARLDTSPIFLTSGLAGNNNVLTAGTITGNILVTNVDGADYTTEAAISNIQISSVTTLTINENYADPTGSLYCVVAGDSNYNFSGSISNSAGVITITSVDGQPGSTIVFPGAYLFGTGITTPTQISAYGTNGTTGTGLTGTYQGSVDESVSSFPDGNTNTTFGTFTFGATPNVNLLDGSTITKAGYDLTSGTCNGHHS